MSIRACLSHLLLALLLVLQGVGAAAAATAMADAHRQARTQADAPPCHEAAGVIDPVPPAPGAPSHPCTGSACLCACVHVMAAAVAMPSISASLLPDAAPDRMPRLGHPPPRLSNPLRPPIA